MGRQKDTCLVNLLEIPLGASRTGPTKRLVADLHETARQVDQARNAMAEAWLFWRRTHDWQPPPRPDGKPSLLMHPPVVTPDGDYTGTWVKVEIAGQKRKQWQREDGTRGIGFETYIYHVGRRTAPDVAGTLISSACQEVFSNLKTDVKHHHAGRYRYRWEAIMDHAEQMPSFKKRTIPVPNNAAVFSYMTLPDPAHEDSDAPRPKGYSPRERADYWARSGAALSFPIFSESSGRLITAPTVALNVGPLSRGNRALLLKVARGEWKLCDSELVFKKNRWQIQFTYQRPSESLGLNPDRVATLWPQFSGAERPFMIESVEPDRRWQVGHGRWLATEFRRLDDRRKRIRGRYKVALSGVKGHGHKRFEARLKPWARLTHNCQRHFTWQLIAEVVRFCKANDCGTVKYREPTLAMREWLWLGKQDVPYDWTSLLTDMSHKCRQLGIVLNVERVTAKELRERQGDAKSPEAARVSEVVTPPASSDNAVRSRFCGSR